MADPRRQRIENEWRLLGRVCEVNAERLRRGERREEGLEEVFEATLVGWPCLDGPDRVSREDRTALIRFPRFYPAQPLEITLDRAVFHPNVDAASGLVCLWNPASPLLTVADALEQLRRVLAWETWSESEEHAAQPEALRWAGTGGAAKIQIADRGLELPPEWISERMERLGEGGGGRKRILD